MSENDLKALQGIHFTAREIDIIACILHMRGTSKMASLLSMAPRTVETHISNIMRKIDCNAREGIIDFIEKSGAFFLIHKHYQKLCEQAIFEQFLQKIAVLTRKKEQVCWIIDRRQQQEKIAFPLSLKKHLERIGVKIYTVRNGKEDRSLFSNYSDMAEKAHIFYLISELPHFRKEEDTSSSHCTFLIYNQSVFFDNWKELEGAQYINFSEKENYSFAFFGVLKRLFPDVCFAKLFNEFTEQTSSSSGQSLPPYSLKDLKKQEKKRNKSLWKDMLENKLAVISILCSILPVFFFFFNDNNVSMARKRNLSVRSDLLIPTENTFLKRPELIKKIADKLDSVVTRYLPRAPSM